MTVAAFVVSALLVAVTTNDPAADEENVAEDVVWLLSVPPVVDQVTPAAPTSLVTVAESARDCDVVMAPRFGVSVTLTAPCTMAIVAELDLVLSAIEVALSETVAGAGMPDGAV